MHNCTAWFCGQVLSLSELQWCSNDGDVISCPEVKVLTPWQHLCVKIFATHNCTAWFCGQVLSLSELQWCSNDGDVISCPEVNVLSQYLCVKIFATHNCTAWFCGQVLSLSYNDELRREEGCLDSKGQEGNTLTLKQCHYKLPSMKWKHDKVWSLSVCCWIPTTGTNRSSLGKWKHTES